MMMNQSKSIIGGLLLVIALLANVKSSLATDYFTLTDGNWNNTTNVWSVDGVNPCGCTPGYDSNGDNIIIRDQITTTANVSVTGGSVLTVQATGNIIGSNNLFINEGVGNFYGDVSLAKVVVEMMGTLNLYSLMTLSNRLEIFGLMTIDGGYVYMTSGNVEIEAGGTLITSNAGKVDVNNGNINNEGFVDICSTCCMTTSGNWKNFNTVVGSGSATTTLGNMNNYGSWNELVTWCSVGSDTGMPSEEDCVNSNTTCGIAVLPVELVRFEATNINDEFISVDWSTASERNASHFDVMKSTDGINWELVETVTAVGNSVSTSNYNTIDFDVDFSVAYYQLVQVDFDGTTKSSPAVSVKGTAKGLTIFPNPSQSNGSISIMSDAEGTIKLINMNGRVLYNENVQSGLNTIQTEGLSLKVGVYFLEYSGNNSYMREKLIITH